jgi:hypothetical protein
MLASKHVAPPGQFAAQPPVAHTPGTHKFAPGDEVRQQLEKHWALALHGQNQLPPYVVQLPDVHRRPHTPQFVLVLVCTALPPQQRSVALPPH